MARAPRIVPHRFKTALVQTTGRLLSGGKSPEEAFGDLFNEVQMRRIYSDGKTFVDLVPRKRANEIMREYRLAKKDPNFNLSEFLSRHFYEFAPHKEQVFIMSPDRNPRQHVTELWPQLQRRNRKNRGSLLALPYEYVVPGGRFSEQFYWDTYFIMLGLAADDRWDTIEGMMKNYVYMIKKYGFIPTANRSYFLSRSQPPFFSHMVKLLATNNGKKRTYFEYLPHLLAEYRFWIKGKATVKSHVDSQAYARVVRMPNGATMARYYDNQVTPRPESQFEDLETAENAANKDKIFLDLRAGAESGWDFSSRWFRDPQDIRTIHTTDLVAVDLNCLLYDLEVLIAETYSHLKQSVLEKKFRRLAEQRADAIRRYCWDDASEFFYDFDFRVGEATKRATLAAVFPLASGIATPEQAAAVARKIETDFLKSGGVVSTLENTGQQWDLPNGWAPLQWVTIQGLRRYGYNELANEIKKRWMSSTEMVFSTRHKMIEKYDVVDENRLGGGGEYPLQDGFGWTNGVYAALHDEFSL